MIASTDVWTPRWNLFEHLALNEWAAAIAEDLLANQAVLGCNVLDISGAQVVDCGVVAPGSLEAGQLLSLACMADLADVEIALDRLEGKLFPKVTVSTPYPVASCLLSQYAGWRIQIDDYFAMGSGPMRAIRGDEPIFEKLGYREEEFNVAVGVLEAAKLPTESVVRSLADSLGVHTDELILLVARTASLAGCYQIVARSIEACLHKMNELGFDVTCVRSGIGSAFLPPVPTDDLTAIGRTNDSILYGGEVMLWVESDDDRIQELGQQLPSSSSSDYGRPFTDIYQKYNGDFYKIDPLLFSPALVAINNLTTGRLFHFGQTDPAIVLRSFMT